MNPGKEPLSQVQMSRARSAVAGLLAAVVVVSLVPGGAIGQAAEASSPEVPDPVAETPPVAEGAFAAQETSGSFSASTYRVTRGSAVEITFSHSDDATLYVGDEDAGYRLRVNVSGSGTSTVTIHTYDSTSRDPNEYVDGGDASLLYPETGLSASLAPTEYNLNLTVDGVPQDLGMLVIEARQEASLNAHIAPRSLDRIQADHGDVMGAATPENRVARGDYAVIEINASGLGEAINPNNLRGTDAANGFHLRFEDQRPEPNKDGDSFSVASASNGVLTYWNQERENLLVVWDTSEVSLQGGSHTYNVTLSIEADYNHLLEEDSLEDNLTVTVVRPAVDLETDLGQLDVYPWEDDVIALRGSTNYAPGTEFEFRARAFEPRPFLQKAPATVSQNGTFGTQMDFSGEARGISFPLWIQNRRDLGEWEVSLRAANATFDFHNQTAEDGRRARVENVSLGVGGFLVVDDMNGTRLGVSALMGEERIGMRNLTLSPPLDRSAYLRVTAVMDVNENGTYDPGVDRPYPENDSNGSVRGAGANASRVAVVFVPETGEPRPPDAATNRTNTTPEMNGTTTATNTTTNRSTTATVTTLSVATQDPLTPGTTSGNAGLSIALPVVALLAVALLARRRRP